MSTPAATPRKRKPTLPKLIDKYYADLSDLARQNVMYEMGTRPAFHALLAAAGKESGWTLNREDDPQYIVRLVCQVVRVSVETIKIVNDLPKDYGTAEQRPA